MYPYDIPDHPVIQNMERTGYPDGKEPDYPTCPACATSECTEIYKDLYGDIIGCENCIQRKDADDVPAFVEKTGDDTLCPICQKPCETAYLDRDNNPVGCDLCIKETNAWEENACFPERP